MEEELNTDWVTQFEKVDEKYENSIKKKLLLLMYFFYTLIEIVIFFT